MTVGLRNNNVRDTNIGRMLALDLSPMPGTNSKVNFSCFI